MHHCAPVALTGKHFETACESFFKTFSTTSLIAGSIISGPMVCDFLFLACEV